MPFFGNVDEAKKSNLQDRAEDVPFEEVKEPTKEQPKIDEKARAEQISKAVEEQVSGLLEKSPTSALLYITAFISGADWSDRHPMSSYNSRIDWMEAMRAEVQKLLNEASKKKDYLIEALFFATFAHGAKWANEHPAPTV